MGFVYISQRAVTHSPQQTWSITIPTKLCQQSRFEKAGVIPPILQRSYSAEPKGQIRVRAAAKVAGRVWGLKKKYQRMAKTKPRQQASNEGKMNKANNKERELSCISVGELEGFESLSSQLPAHKSKKGSPLIYASPQTPSAHPRAAAWADAVPRITAVPPGSGHTWWAASRECCHLFHSILPRRPNQAWTLKQALASDLFLSIIQVVCSNPNLRCRTFHSTAYFLFPC